MKDHVVTRAVTTRFKRTLKLGVFLPAVALLVGLFTMIGSQNAGAIYLLGPDPTSMTGSSGCIGSVVTFYGHEFYGGGMTADFGSYTSNVYNINVPIGDNDTANATAPSAPAGTYTVTLTDRYGNGAVPGTFTILPCIVIPRGNWIATSATMAFKPGLVNGGTGTSSSATSSFSLKQPFDMQVIDKSATATMSMSLGSNDCSSLSEGSTTATTTLNVTWKPNSIESTTVTFTGFSVSETSTGGISLTFGGDSTTATGSYASTDSGATSTLTLVSATTPAQIANSCAAKGGLKSLDFSVGANRLSIG